jgi:hypothetical protein
LLPKSSEYADTIYYFPKENTVLSVGKSFLKQNLKPLVKWGGIGAILRLSLPQAIFNFG